MGIAYIVYNILLLILLITMIILLIKKYKGNRVNLIIGFTVIFLLISIMSNLPVYEVFCRHSTIEEAYRYNGYRDDILFSCENKDLAVVGTLTDDDSIGHEIFLKHNEKYYCTSSIISFFNKRNRNIFLDPDYIIVMTYPGTEGTYIELQHIGSKDSVITDKHGNQFDKYVLKVDNYPERRIYYAVIPNDDKYFLVDGEMIEISDI